MLILNMCKPHAKNTDYNGKCWLSPYSVIDIYIRLETWRFFFLNNLFHRWNGGTLSMNPNQLFLGTAFRLDLPLTSWHMATVNTRWYTQSFCHMPGLTVSMNENSRKPKKVIEKIFHSEVPRYCLPYAIVYKRKWHVLNHNVRDRRVIMLFLP